MSISQDSGAVIVCREVFDEDSRPSNEEVLDYAKRLGIDPDAEPHLLDLARTGLMAPLPKGWSPCLDEATGAWYYYQASTRTTTWEHPLDARHRALVERARARSASRQLSLDDDSKTTAKELESHEEASFPKEAPQSKVPVAMTKIPTKLAPLSRKTVLEPIVRRKDSSIERLHRRNTTTDTSRSENLTSSLMTDRAARDYTNVVFQDPKFYETPRLLDSPEREMKLKEIVKRSESMSPRYEKDWEQLSSKFSSEENVIDIDKLSASSLTRSETKLLPEKFDKEKHPKNLNQQKELTLSGGGSMFLKSNRSRDNTPCQETGRLEDFQQALALEGSNENIGHSIGERPKSILREKPADDEERPMDEERKSVRFDLEKDPKDIKFTFSAFEDDVEDPADNSDSESEGSGQFGLKNHDTFFSSLRRVDSKSRAGLSRLGWLSNLDSADQGSDEEAKIDVADDDGSARKENDSEAVEDDEKDSKDVVIHINKESEEATTPRDDPDPNSEDKEAKSNEENEKDVETAKESKNEQVEKRMQVIGRRFVVQNVSEKEHFNRLTRIETKDIDNDHLPKNKFGNVKNIDLFSKSESDSTGAKSSVQDDSKSSLLDEIRKSKELMMENMKRTDQRAKRDKQKERDEVYHMVKLRHDLEAMSQERDRLMHRNFNDVKTVMSKQHDIEVTSFKRELEISLDHTKREMEANFTEEKLKLERDMKKRLDDLKADLTIKEEEEIKNLVAEMDELRMENLKKVRNELEICYEKERQDILENLKTELDQRKRELLDLRNQEMEKLQSEHDKGLAEEKIVFLTEHEVSKEHNEKIEAMKRELEKEFDDLRNELRTEQREKVTKITEDHEKCLAEILRDFRVDEGLARKVYKQRLEEIRSDFSRDTEKEVKKQAERVSRQETVDFEKIRCEKRLLEDKYKTLKDKYSKLKNDVRLAVERRSKRKEGNTTTSETEKSTSARTRTERTDPSDQKASPTNTRSSSIANTGFGRTQPAAGVTSNQNQAHNSATEDSEGGQRSSIGFPRSSAVVGHVTTGIGDCSSRSSGKFESDDTTTASETVNSNILKNKRKSFARRSTSSVKQSHNNNNVSGSDNPVENIRKQLEKLEDLGDQLPSTESAYTLRYPFQDKAPANASSELEFFRHRIHVERDSVKRAREALRVQRSAFQGRQRAWKQKSARATLEQLVQEERELSDMEVSLHRTRSLLGEKVIYLRHLEQSLERVANAKRNESESIPLKNDEMTLSDMSSASSGFSSTDLGTDTFIDKPDHYQESTEIIASLENLNSEIREIWGVLNKRQDNNIPPPPTLMYSDLGWLPFQHLTTQSSNVQGFGTPNIQSNILSQLTAAHPPTTTTQNIIAQYGPNSGFTTSVGTVERGASSLIERTRHMRDWLRQARIESTDLISPGQATL